MSLEDLVGEMSAQADKLKELNHSVLFDLGDEGKIRLDQPADFPPDSVEPLLDPGLEIAERDRRGAGDHREVSPPSRWTRSPRSRNRMSTARARS